MQETLNYRLKKPEQNDYVNVQDLNYNADIIDTKLKENESHLADIVKDVGDKTTLKTTDKTNLVGAINELFTNANNGKTLISNVVGSPLLATDTFQQQSNKIQDIKNDFANKLNSKNVSANGSENLQELVNKVGDIVLKNNIIKVLSDLAISGYFLLSISADRKYIVVMDSLYAKNFKIFDSNGNLITEHYGNLFAGDSSYFIYDELNPGKYKEMYYNGTLKARNNQVITTQNAYGIFTNTKIVVVDYNNSRANLNYFPSNSILAYSTSLSNYYFFLLDGQMYWVASEGSGYVTVYSSLSSLPSSKMKGSFYFKVADLI